MRHLGGQKEEYSFCLPGCFFFFTYFIFDASMPHLYVKDRKYRTFRTTVMPQGRLRICCCCRANRKSGNHRHAVIVAYSLSGTNFTISSTEQFSILQSASNVLVDTDSPAFNRLMVELLTLPFTCNVYVVAPFRSIVSHKG